MNIVKFSKMHPAPAYDGPRPVYLCEFPWGGQRCYVRRRKDSRYGWVWETAPIVPYLHMANFSPSPVASAFNRRYDAVMAFDYYHNQGAKK